MRDAPPRGRPAGERRPDSASGGRSHVRLLRAGVAVLLLGGLLSGCATKGDLRDLRAEVRELSARQDSLLRTLVELQRASLDSLAAQSDVLFSIRGEVSRQLLQVQEQLVTVQELTGQSQRALAGLRDQIETRRTRIVRPEAREPASDTAGPRADTAAQTRDTLAQGPDTAVAPPSGVEAGGSPEELYNVAVRQFNRGQRTTARRAFERFLEEYPNHRLAPDAHWYLGSILADEERFEEAVQTFLEIPELFPTAERVPDALYRAALAQIELENTDEARQLLERVVNSYPDSAAATLAEEKLNELPEP